MSLTVYNKSKWLDSFFDEVFNAPVNSGREWGPVVDVHDTGKSFVLEAELPGLKREDIKVEVKDNILSISGVREHAEKAERKDYYLQERAFGSFRRTFQLNSNVDASKIHAEYKDGVLKLEIPKSEKAQARMIEIK